MTAWMGYHTITMAVDNRDLIDHRLWLWLVKESMGQLVKV